MMRDDRHKQTRQLRAPHIDTPLFWAPILQTNNDGARQLHMGDPPMIRAIFLFAAVVLAGCAGHEAAPSQAEIDAGVRSDAAIGKAQCAARFPLGPRVNHVAQAKCYNDYEVAVIRSRIRYPDLSVLVNAKRLAIAEQADQGVMTDAAADAAMAEVISSVTSEYVRRANSEAQTQAQGDAARAAQSSAISAAQAVPNPFVAPPPPPCMVLIGGRCR
jgi:hypothetical protein